VAPDGPIRPSGVRTHLVAIVKADEALRLELLQKAAVASWLKPPSPRRGRTRYTRRGCTGEEFFELRLLQRRVVAAAIQVTLAVRLVRPGPFTLGKIERQLDAVFVARLPQIGEDIAAQGRFGDLCGQ